MHATEVVGYVFDGAIYCPDCFEEPDAESMEAHGGVVFADAEGWEHDCCSGCGELLGDAAGIDWRPSELEIACAMGRTAFLVQYADGVEDGTVDGDSPGAGGDWDDVAGDTPPAFEDAAEQYLAALPDSIDVGLIAALWLDDTGLELDRFGHCLAMQALGHGVGLNDDTRGFCVHTTFPSWEPVVTWE